VKATLCLLLVPLAFVLAACAPRQTEDQKFEALAKSFIENFIETHPEWATTLGDHRFDTRLNDYSLAGIEADRQSGKSCLASLGTIDSARLSPINRIDYQILKTNLESLLFQLDTVREYEWNPLNYNIGGAIYSLTAREFAPLKNRLLSVKERLKGISAVLAAARTNLKNPPRIHTETAIRQNPGTIGLVRDELNQYLNQAPEMKAELAPLQAQAISALEEYGKWLQQDLLPRSNGDFRIGDEKFRRKLYYSLNRI
jgi:uncharacterized protein (DUF885 family)